MEHDHSVKASAKVVAITGGESGIGRATARRFADLGYRVYVCDCVVLQENAVEFSRLEIGSMRCDVRSVPDLESWIAHVALQAGRLDVLVNNAGIGMTKQIDAVTEEDWDNCLGVNLKAAFFGCKAAIPQMQRGGGGSIINVSSNAGLLPRAHDPVYSISKQALVGLTKSLALCHSIDRIRINAVCPGPVGETGMMNADLAKAVDMEATRQKFIDASPLARAHGRMISPEEVADAIVYLASEQAAMVTGTCISIDGGKSLGVPPVSR